MMRTVQVDSIGPILDRYAARFPQGFRRFNVSRASVGLAGFNKVFSP